MPDPKQNLILAALSNADLDRLVPYLEPVSLSIGETIKENGEQFQHAYFPTTARVSLMHVAPDLTAEVATVGNDGIVGIPLFLGDGVTAFRAVVRFPGEGYRLDGQLLRYEFDRAESFRTLLLRYTLTRFLEASAVVGRGATFGGHPSFTREDLIRGEPWP